jgi:hypothetical protein
VAAKHEKELLIGGGVILVVLVDDAVPCFTGLQAVTPNAVMPNWWRIGR